MNIYDIIMRNEGGDRLVYEIAAENPEKAAQEAWRRYRGLSYWDGEMPPVWTKFRIGDAEDRDDEPPALNEYGFVLHDGHCVHYIQFVQLTTGEHLRGGC